VRNVEAAFEERVARMEVQIKQGQESAQAAVLAEATRRRSDCCHVFDVGLDKGLTYAMRGALWAFRDAVRQCKYVRSRNACVMHRVARRCLGRVFADFVMCVQERAVRRMTEVRAIVCRRRGILRRALSRYSDYVKARRAFTIRQGLLVAMVKRRRQEQAFAFLCFKRLISIHLNRALSLTRSRRFFRLLDRVLVCWSQYSRRQQAIRLGILHIISKAHV
jgi:hypothetical protein